MFDIQRELDKRIENIILSRNRLKYKSQDSTYAVYLVDEIFKYRYTMHFMWDTVMSYANQDFPNCAADSYNELLEIFEKTYSEIVSPRLQSLYSNPEYEWVGAIHRDGFNELIVSCKHGNRRAREEIEFSYLYYTICDLCTLCWAAQCSSGLGKLDAIKMITGCIIQPMPLNEYKVLTNGLGELFVSRFLEQNYTPLP